MLSQATEGQRVAEVVQRTGRMFRINTWFRLHSNLYGMGCPARPLKQLVAGGLLGWPITARLSHHTGFKWKLKWRGRTNLAVEPVPGHLDYDMWLGPAPAKPYNRHRTHSTFRGYWDYDSGGLGDMGQHYLDPIQYILGKDDTSPVEVVADGPWPQHPDAVGDWYTIEMKYADGCRIILESSASKKNLTAGKPFLEGPNGKVFPRLRTEPASLKDALRTLPAPEPMIGNFNVSVKTRRKFGLNEVTSQRSNILVHLGDIAVRMGRPLRFDPITQRFIDDDAANRLIDQPMRAPWDRYLL